MKEADVRKRCSAPTSACLALVELLHFLRSFNIERAFELICHRLELRDHGLRIDGLVHSVRRHHRAQTVIGMQREDGAVPN